MYIEVSGGHNSSDGRCSEYLYILHILAKELEDLAYNLCVAGIYLDKYDYDYVDDIFYATFYLDTSEH